MDAPVIGPSSPTISLPPWTLLGHRVDGRPIYNLAGGAEDDEDTDIEVDDDTGDDETDQDEEEHTDDGEQPDADDAPKPKAPSANPELERMRAEQARTVKALQKANDEAKRYRLALKEREAKDRTDEGDQERALREAAEAVEAKWKPRIIGQAARAGLAAAGLAGDPARMLRLLDLDALDVDDDGDVVGLESEIDRLKAEYEELFARPEPARPKARPTAAPRPPAPDTPKASWDRHAARLRGN